MHHLLNALAALAFAISYASEAGAALFTPFFNFSCPLTLAACGAGALLIPAAASAACHHAFGDPDLFGIASGERRHTSLFALPVILIALYHVAAGDDRQALFDIDFAGTLCCIGIVVFLIGLALPDPPPDNGEHRPD